MKHVDAAIAELEAEIAKLEEAKGVLLRLRTPAEGPAAKPARRPAPRRAAPARKPRKAPEPEQAADADALNDNQVKVLRFLDKNGPAQAPDIAEKGLGKRTYTGPLSGKILPALVKRGLVEDNSGFFRLTDKGADAALQ